MQRHPRYRTEICKSYHILGKCRYGTRCKFIHLKPGESLPPGCTLVDDTPPVSHRSSSMAALVDDSTPVNQLIPEKMFDLVLGDNPLIDNTSLSSSASCSASFSELPSFTQVQAQPPLSSPLNSTTPNNNNNNNTFSNTFESNLNIPNTTTIHFNSNGSSPVLSSLNSQQQQQQSTPLLSSSTSLTPTSITTSSASASLSQRSLNSPLSLGLKLQPPHLNSGPFANFQSNTALGGQRLHLPLASSASPSQPNSNTASPPLSSASPPLTTSGSQEGAAAAGGAGGFSGGGSSGINNTVNLPAIYQQRSQSQNVHPLRIVRSNSGIIGKNSLSRLSSINYGNGLSSSSSSSSSNLAMVSSAGQHKSASYSKLPGYNQI